MSVNNTDTVSFGLTATSSRKTARGAHDDGHTGVAGIANTWVVESMALVFEGRVVEWRGPAPFYFVAIPEDESDEIKVLAKGIEYWGQVPVTALINNTEFSTALFPKDGRYLLPLKKAVRESAQIAVDQTVPVELRVGRHSVE
jgi:hypothetical protein